MLNRTSVPALVTVILFASLGLADSNWPGWRGPTRDGHSQEKGFPKKWTAENVRWKKELPGDGQSSPVVWGDRIFLTTALDNGRERVVLCLNRKDGEILWQKSVWKGTPEPSHRMNGWASSTVITDGTHLWAFFGQGGGLFCLTLDGEQVWNKPLGDFPGPWGTAASPLLAGELLIQNCDSDENGYLIAVEKLTGDEVWRVPREKQRGWSSPILIPRADGQEMVLQGHSGIRAYNPATGEENWRVSGTRGRGTPTVTPAHGLVYFLPGRGGAVYAIRPGGKGDVTKSHTVWQTPRKGRDLPSPIVVGDYVVVVSMRGGIMSCYSAKSGKELWVERIGGNFTASPVAFDGLAAFISDEGQAIVVEPADEPKIVSRNNISTLDTEIFRSSITPTGGELLIRSTKVLYCVK